MSFQLGETNALSRFKLVHIAGGETSFAFIRNRAGDSFPVDWQMKIFGPTQSLARRGLASRSHSHDFCNAFWATLAKMGRRRCLHDRRT